jgi:membrane protein CcdC involved in cytochrome C biogenesis
MKLVSKRRSPGWFTRVRLVFPGFAMTAGCGVAGVVFALREEWATMSLMIVGMLFSVFLLGLTLTAVRGLPSTKK